MRTVNLRDPEIWTRVSKYIDELEDLVSLPGHVLAQLGRERPVEVLQSSDEIFAPLDRVKPKLRSIIFGLFRKAVRDQLDEFGDGGKTLVILAATLIRHVAKNFQRVRNCEISALEDGFSLEPLGVGKEQIQEHLNYCTQDLPDDLREAILNYFIEAGLYAKVRVTEGMAEQTKLRSLRGYELKWENPPPFGLLSCKPIGSRQDPLVVVYDGAVKTMQDVEDILEIPNEAGFDCLVFCRSQNIKITHSVSMQTYLKEGKFWCFFSVSHDDYPYNHLTDIAAFSECPVLRGDGIRSMTPEKYGGVEQFEIQGENILLTNEPERPDDLLAYINELKPLSDNLEGHAKTRFLDRVAMLSGDCYELAIGARHTPVELRYLKSRTQKAFRSAQQMASGTCRAYHLELTKILTNLGINPGRFRDFPIQDHPYSYSTLRRIWLRAWSLVRSLTMSDVVILGD